ncbi:hypothetical protein [Lentibacillus salicampi]|uniref:Thiopeptide-type bacteriocin biosynthesis domain-containing protein n=1 Tax=Lentibacillus salicampi TaxID=175306 RepID=A0A4Y9A6A6_9BACI|nr:hypothetical protein [Lentibacillus salicampi]TFJ90255.1 hypothetical protein E4U82_19315 [Lentibacillus salicampi]
MNLKNTIMELITDYTFIVDKGWENGYHIHLRGPLDDESLQKIIIELEKGVSDSIIKFDETEFIRRYKSISEILENKTDPFKPILKGKVTVDIENSIFENEMENELFRESNHMFDLYYCRSYFNKNSLYAVIEDIMKFHNMLEAYEEPGSTDAYNCHLSHYIAFNHRLNKQSKESIEKHFKIQFEKELEAGLFEFDLSPTTLTKDLMNFFHKIRPLVKSRQLNFYMPYDRKFIDKKINYGSKRHQETFSKDNMHNHLYNDVLIANRWITNALYKKLLLLGLSNTDRFYMNYVISRLTYSEDELRDY